MKNIPEKIWLQIDPDNESPGVFDELSGITEERDETVVPETIRNRMKKWTIN